VAHTALLIAGLAFLVGLTACGDDGGEDPAELGEGPAFVEDVVVEDRDGEYWATVSGFYPDACSTYGGSEQQVDGNTITLTVTSTRPEDAVCAQVLTDMTEEILLDTEGLAPGRYEVVVNQGRSTSFTIS